MKLLFQRTVFCTSCLLLLSHLAKAEMSVGFNLWSIGWGSSIAGQPQYNYFKQGVNWKTTTDPWNPTFISELIESKTRCLRFMDWGKTNGCNYTTWSQRIPKTANHTGMVENLVPTFWGNEAGVAYEWMIDLCNRVNCDLWICVPHKANDNFVTQLATLIKDNLNPALRVYVEYSNECWNYVFPQSTWLEAQANLSGIPNPVDYLGRKVYGVGGGGDCMWSEYVYYSCKVVDLFNKVFGENSTRLIRVLAGQAGSGGSGGMNDMCLYHLWCAHSPIVNPLKVKFDIYAVAPYYSGGSESEMRKNLADAVTYLGYFRNSLKADGLQLTCYEGGPDNFSSVPIAHLPFQYQLTADALKGYGTKVEGIFCWYTFIGSCWGLKNQVGDPVSASPKWRAYIEWLPNQPGVSVHTPMHLEVPTAPAFFDGPMSFINLRGQYLGCNPITADHFSIRRNVSPGRIIGSQGSTVFLQVR